MMQRNEMWAEIAMQSGSIIQQQIPAQSMHYLIP